MDRNVALILEGMRRNATPPLYTQAIEAARTVYDKGLRLLDLAPDASVSVRDERLGAGAAELWIREYTPPAPGALPACSLVWFHGGGFCVGSLETSDILCRMFAARGGHRVYSAAYRLAPEHPFPAAVDDALRAWEWVVSRPASGAPHPPRVAVAGDSAGGTLAAVVSLLARERGLAPPAAQLLVYPGTLGCRKTASRQRFAEGHFLTSGDIEWFHRQYTQGRDLDDDPRFAPIAARSHRGQPPTLILAAEFDPLVDDAIAYADALAAAGNEVQCEVYPGMIHGFFNMGGLVPAAREAHARATRFLAETLGAESAARTA